MALKTGSKLLRKNRPSIEMDETILTVSILIIVKVTSDVCYILTVLVAK